MVDWLVGLFQDPYMSRKTETRNGRWTRSLTLIIKIKSWNSLSIGRAMTTRIVPGSWNRISATLKKLWQTSITQTPQHPGPFPSHQRIPYYCFKRGWSLLQVFTPNKYLLIAWKSIFREGVVLRLYTPNISTMDLVVFPFFPLSYLINLWQPRCPYVSLFISPPCLMHSSPHLSPCSAWLCSPFFSSILPPPCGCLMILLLFHFMAMLNARFHLMLLDNRNILEQSLVDPVQIGTYICSSI